MDIGAVLGFWTIAALLILVPGPDWAFAISAGLLGRVVPAAAGIVLGYLAMTVAVAGGLGVLIASTPSALTVLTVLGGGYLVWLGLLTLARPPAPPTVEVPRPTSRAVIARGFGVSGLNPKGLLVFVALLPQFASPAAGSPMTVQLAVLGLVFTGTCAAVYLVVGASAGRVLRARPAGARIVARVSGGCLVCVGAGLLLEHFR